MKLPRILIACFLWLASVGTAYYCGLQLNKPTDKVAAKTELRSSEKIIERAARESAEDRPPSEDLVTSILSASIEDLDTALRRSESLTEAQVRELLGKVFALPANDYRRGRMIRELLGQLAETAPREALAMAEEIGSLRETERARVAILEVWGRQDPLAALAWARRDLADEPLRTRSSQLLAIFRGYTATNPQAAFAAALNMPAENSGERRMQTQALEEILSEQIRNGGLLEAKLAVERLESGPTKDRLISELVDEWASYDPEGAAAYVESMGEGASADMKTALLSEWAENDPAAAALWLSAREVDEAVLGRASTAIIREWTRYDMTASAEWLNSLPDSPELDRAVMSYTYRAAQEDPANAMTWAESINNDWMRTRMMERVAGSWKTDDPDAFQSYLDSSDMSEEQKEKLMQAEDFHSGRRWWR